MCIYMCVGVGGRVLINEAQYRKGERLVVCCDLLMTDDRIPLPWEALDAGCW